MGSGFRVFVRRLFICLVIVTVLTGSRAVVAQSEPVPCAVPDPIGFRECDASF